MNLSGKRNSLRVGLYEQLINVLTGDSIAEAPKENLRTEIRELDPGDSHSYISHYLAELICHRLVLFPQSARLAGQIAIANRIIALLAEEAPNSFDGDQVKILRAELLMAVLKETAEHMERPDTPLSKNCLMTGTRQDPSLISQLRKEFLSADRVDILCSFIKWGGIRILQESLQKHAEDDRPLRVITTSYMGATDLKAVEYLHKLSNVDLRVSYDTRRTRLHAKAYMFHRETGFGVAYIGSSNLSQSALTDGLEWNVKISQNESPHLWAKLCATFETYWNDKEFVHYDQDSRVRLQEALRQERGSTDGDGIHVVFDIKPYPFQQEILDKLAAERAVHQRFRNLVVAATGTGKTVISAFDYARFKRESEKGGEPRLLFVAHREEILKQSLACFRMVLRDNNFGDLLVGDSEPKNLNHLFVSIQSFNSRVFWEKVPDDYYEFVVVDEFHHAAAPSYQRLLEFLRPGILLGLTATPERMDSLDIVSHFGGHVAAEIRLPDAINRKLLCPFQYFGITDSIDFSAVRWQRGGYDVQELNRLVIGNDIRAQLIIDKVREILLDVRHARGLGFCVSIRHTKYMADVFNRANIPAMSLSAESPDELRRNAQRKLISREVNFIFVVDLYNEGVDIPQADTILLLRPTESLTVFLQQLGRGLRQHEDKDWLTILDFIGQAHQNFNYEARFRALIGQSERRVDKEIEQGLPHMPAGCAVNLERVAAGYILENIRQATTHNRNRLVRRIASFTEETGKALTLRNFVDYHLLDLDEIYQRDSWSRLLVQAGLADDFSDPDEKRIATGLRRVAKVNALKQLNALVNTLPNNPASCFKEPTDEISRRFLLMLHFLLWTREWCPKTLAKSVQRLRDNPTLYSELRQLLNHNLEDIDEVPTEIKLPFPCPLQLHANYTRDEILAGLGVWTLKSQRDVREGVLYVESLPADLFFITLNKAEDDYSPSTMYEDYAISDELFHWQSQSTTSLESPTGQRYIEHAQRGVSVLIFVREDKRHNGFTRPYIFLGPAEYVSHMGSKPISIVWRLKHKLPAKLLRHIRRLAND